MQYAGELQWGRDVPYIIQGMSQLLASGKDLPTLPVFVLQLHRVLDLDTAGPNEVADVIERDPALVARLLKVANSAAYNRGTGGVGSVASAVALMGINQVRAVCMVLGVVKAFPSGAGSGIDHTRLWEHSAATAVLAKRLWQEFGSDPTFSADDAYVAGLLHDVGLLVLQQFFQRDFREALDACRAGPQHTLWRCEEQLLGMDHGAVGGLLMGRWSLPELTREAIINHHHPEEADERFRLLARIIQAAEVLTQGVGSNCPRKVNSRCRRKRPCPGSVPASKWRRNSCQKLPRRLPGPGVSWTEPAGSRWRIPLLPAASPRRASSSRRAGPQVWLPVADIGPRP